MNAETSYIEGFRVLIGANMSRRRAELGITQTQAAGRVAAALGDNVSRSRYAQWETARRPMNVDALGAVSVALETTPVSLVSRPMVA